jgi:hypothetical protein
LLLAAALALGGCGEGEATDALDADPVDTCAAVATWDEAMVDATNGYSRAAREVGAADERRRLYLAAFDELAELVEDLAEQVGDDASMRDAVAFARAVVSERQFEADRLPDDAYEVLSVPGGGLFTASERARSTVLSAARPGC